MDTRPGYSTQEAMASAGISYRQIDYWDRMRLVSPSLRAAQGSGSQRLYSYRDVVELCVVVRLRHLGVEIEHCAKALKALRENVSGRKGGYLVLCADGLSVVARASNLLAVLGGQGGVVVVLGTVLTDLDRALGLDRESKLLTGATSA